MATLDIGTILFVEILGIAQYPGSPFTGNIIQDIVLYFFVPSVLLILVIYMATIIVVPGQARLRLLFGIAAYAFVIAGRYFAIFALSAASYMLLVILFAILLFVFRHFRSSDDGGPRSGGGRSATVRLPGQRYDNPEDDPHWVDQQIRKISKQLRDHPGSDAAPVWADELRELERKRYRHKGKWRR